MLLITSPEQIRVLYDEVRRRLSYDLNTGTLMWLPDSTKPDWWQARWADKPAFTTKHRDGYHIGYLNKQQWRKDRIVWLWQYGDLRRDIYHANRNLADDSLINLRAYGLAETSGYPASFYTYLQSRDMI